MRRIVFAFFAVSMLLFLACDEESAAPSGGFDHEAWQRSKVISRELQAAQDLAERALAARNPELVRTAQTWYERIIAAEPHNDIALAELGQLYLQAYCFTGMLSRQPDDCARKQEEVRLLAERAVAQDPHNPLAHQNLGQYWDFRDKAKAFEHYQRAAELDPRDLMAQFFVAKCYLDQNDWDHAREKLEALLDKAMAACDERVMRTALEHLGRVAMAEGEYQKAEKLMRQAADGVTPENPAYNHGCPYQALGELYNMLGKRAKAAKALSQVADLEPFRPEKQLEAAINLFKAGDYEGAWTYGSRALALSPDPKTKVFLALLCLFQRRYDVAVDMLRDPLAQNANDPAALMVMGHYGLIRREYERARASFLPAAESYRRAFESVDPWSSVEQKFQAFVYRMAVLGIAWYYANQNQHEDAIRQFDLVLQSRPRGLLCLLGKGNSLIGLNRLREAEETFRKVLAIQPDNAYALAEMAAVEYNRGDYDEAEQLYRKAIASDPSRAYTCPYEGLGLIYLRQGKLSDAKQNFEQAIALNPDMEYKKFNGLAKIYIKEGRYGEARPLLEKSIANYPYDPEAKELLRRLPPP